MKIKNPEILKSGAFLFLLNCAALCILCAASTAMILGKLLPQQSINAVSVFAPIAAALIGAIIMMPLVREKKMITLAIGNGAFAVLQAVILIQTEQSESVLPILLGIIFSSAVALMLSNRKRKSSAKRYDKLLYGKGK